MLQRERVGLHFAPGGHDITAVRAGLGQRLVVMKTEVTVHLDGVADARADKVIGVVTTAAQRQGSTRTIDAPSEARVAAKIEAGIGRKAEILKPMKIPHGNDR